MRNPKTQPQNTPQPDFTNQWRQAVLGDKQARKNLVKNLVRH